MVTFNDSPPNYLWPAQAGKALVGTIYLWPSKSHRTDIIMSGLSKSPNEVHTHLINYISWVDLNTDQNLKRVHTNNPAESLRMKNNLEWKRIVPTTCTSYSTNWNWMAKWIGQTLMNKFWAMIKVPACLEVTGERLLLMPPLCELNFFKGNKELNSRDSA